MSPLGAISTRSGIPSACRAKYSLAFASDAASSVDFPTVWDDEEDI